ncbi:MAG: hypothetical protein J6C96_04075 [Oscillospiraceae bacterium]|nr:hypothetical protein [Oscillospiraceae bacterium]
MYYGEHKYDDIIDLPRPISKKHKPMTITDRAAQFSPFAALTGYDDAVSETARLTDSRLELDEDRLSELNAKLNILRDNLSERPEVTVEYFVPDERKSGGKYFTFSGQLRRIDEYEKKIIFTDGTEIELEFVCGIEIL